MLMKNQAVVMARLIKGSVGWLRRLKIAMRLILLKRIRVKDGEE